MARKRDLGSKLEGRPEGKPAGWQEQVKRSGDVPAAQESDVDSSAAERDSLDTTSRDTAKAGEFVRKTYLLTPDMVQRVETLAKQERVGINELVRYLLDAALTKIEAGDVSLEKKPVQQYTLE
jgi:hypothetical protein